MIDIGTKTKIILKDGSSFGLSNLVEFYDLSGQNVLFIHHQNDQALPCNNIRVEYGITWNQLQEKIFNNLFRLNIIIVSDNKFSDKIEKLIDEQIKLPTIYVARDLKKFESEYSTIKEKYDYWYEFSKEIDSNWHHNMSYDFYSKIIVESKTEDWKIDMNSLKSKWNRNKKIDDLFDE